jgi:hypothetical protein
MITTLAMLMRHRIFNTDEIIPERAGRLILIGFHD